MRNLLNKAVISSLLLTAMPALAQAPHDTISSFPPPQNAENAPVTPAPIPPTDIAPPISSAATPPASIQVDAVSPPSIEAIGTLNDKNNGLPVTIWNGSTKDSASPLLQWTRFGVSNPTLKDLTERLLLSNATAPAGSNSEWLTERVQALIALGSDDKAEQLIAAVPASMVTDSLQQLQAQLQLLRGDSESACKNADKSATGTAAFWAKLNIICKAQAGKTDEASLALDLLRETNASDDGFLQDIIHKFADKKYALKTLPSRLSLFDVAIVRLAGESGALREKIDVMPPVTLKYLAADTSLDPKFRDKAETKAMQYGILPLRDVVKPIPPQPFARVIAGDVTALVASLGGTGEALEADNAIIARLALDDTVGVLDTRRVQRLLTLMEPFGYKVPTETWGRLFARKSRYDGDMPPAGLIDKLTNAAQTGRKGEVIILSALILNGSDVEKVSELVLLPVVKALHQVGFTKEARIIAHDAVQSYSTH